jgi:O-antigen/teichoic acid export membrane protein
MTAPSAVPARKRISKMENKTVASFSWISLALAVLLLVSPWIFGFSGQADSVNSVIGGLLVGAASILALTYHGRWQAWGNLILLNLMAGAWVFISPLLFHYNAVNAATWIHLVVGIAVSTLAVAQLWMIAAVRPAPRLAP